MGLRSKLLFIPRLALAGSLTSFIGYQSYFKLTTPTPYDFKNKSVGKEKTIVVVGGGMVGLSTAYILAKNYPKNKLVLLEKNSAPLEGTSKQNGNLMPLDFTHSWMNVPFSFVQKAVFQYHEAPSRVYVHSFFESFANFAITVKFGIIWMFCQPSLEIFGITLLKI